MGNGIWKLPLAVLTPVLLGLSLVGECAEPRSVTRSLSEFGEVNSKSVAETYQKAITELRKSGGILEIPAEVWTHISAKPAALQGLVRTPEPPAETKRWQTGMGVTVVSHDGKSVIVQVPPLTGLRIERPIRLNEGDSLPHWGTHPAITIDSQIVYGSTSYLDWLQLPVSRGTDRRFYLPTVRGLHPGQFLNLHGGPGYGGGVTRGVVKSLGWDPEKRLHYFVADTNLDHVAGAILQNKSNTGLVHMLQTSHNDNQTYDVKVIRNQFAHGDTYIYYCDFNYMSNVHSAAGDENGNCYAAFIRSKEDVFKSTVEAVDWSTNTLVFGKSNQNTQTLGDSRPIINRNPAKHVTAGKVLIVTGRTDYDLPDPKMCQFEGRDYSTGLVKSSVSNAVERKFGGLIRGDTDCPWTPDIVGRFFAVNEPTEKTPKGTLRWYLITRFVANADGTKEIEIQRFWWGAKSAGAPTLYRLENYTYDGHIRPLSYIIAPGTYVNDVSRAVPGGDRSHERTLGVAPHAAMNTPLDFEKGDAIEQAIGPDPFKPQAMRVWTWEDVPGQYPAAILDAANYGATSRYSVVSVSGGPANLDDIEKRHEQRPAWDNVLVVNTAATIGLNFKADFAKAAILFQQPHHKQAIHWHYGHVVSEPEDKTKTGITKQVSSKAGGYQVAALEVDRDTGTFEFTGGGVKTGGSVSGVKGLSGDDKPARNLRGKNVTVGPQAMSIRITFPVAEPDGDYAVFVEQSWLGNRAISDKSANGFTVSFEKPAPDKATLDWMLVR